MIKFKEFENLDLLNEFYQENESTIKQIINVQPKKYIIYGDTPFDAMMGGDEVIKYGLWYLDNEIYIKK